MVGTQVVQRADCAAEQFILEALVLPVLWATNKVSDIPLVKLSIGAVCSKDKCQLTKFLQGLEVVVLSLRGEEFFLSAKESVFPARRINVFISLFCHLFHL